MALLDEERNYFEANKAKWLTRHKNQYVLVKGSELAGVFGDGQSAYAAGLERFGLQPFLVKQVLAEEPVVYLPMLSMSLPRAGL